MCAFHFAWLLLPSLITMLVCDMVVADAVTVFASGWTSIGVSFASVVDGKSFK